MVQRPSSGRLAQRDEEVARQAHVDGGLAQRHLLRAVDALLRMQRRHHRRLARHHAPWRAARRSSARSQVRCPRSGTQSRPARCCSPGAASAPARLSKPLAMRRAEDEDADAGMGEPACPTSRAAGAVRASSQPPGALAKPLPGMRRGAGNGPRRQQQREGGQRRPAALHGRQRQAATAARPRRWRPAPSEGAVPARAAAHASSAPSGRRP